MPAVALPRIDEPHCTGCGRCVAACPPQVIWLQATGPRGWGPKRAEVHDMPGCTGCARCALACPFGVIRMEKVVAPEALPGEPLAPNDPPPLK